MDEAHNLPDRVRMGMQRRLTPTMVRNAASEVEENLGNMQKVAQINDLMGDAIMLKSWCLAVCKEFRLVLVREFKRMISQIDSNNEMLIKADDVLSWLNEAFDKVAAIVNQSTLTGTNSAFANPDTIVRLKMFKQILESNEVEIDEEILGLEQQIDKINKTLTKLYKINKLKNERQKRESLLAK